MALVSGFGVGPGLFWTSGIGFDVGEVLAVWFAGVDLVELGISWCFGFC